MPDLATRTDHEKEAAAALLLVFGTYQYQLSQGYFPALEYQDSVRRAIIRPLAATYYEASTQLANEHGLSINPARLNAEAWRWAGTKADQVASQVTDTTIGAVRTAAESSLTYEELGEKIGWAFDEARAEAISITETTGAITAGEGLAAGVLRAHGVDLKPFWRTEEDDLVCEECGPLDNQPEEVYEIVAPFGPGMHPRCRCWLEYRTEEEE
jgi:hypothetical protein